MPTFPESMTRLEDVVIDSLRARLGAAVAGFVVAETRDEPTPWLTLEFRVFDYLPVVFVYDRGRGGFSVDYGARRIGMNVPQPTSGIASPEDVAQMVDAFADTARLWVPDKFLEARGW
ncbi:hypothetical protein GCM10022200_22830 [Microbacterium awajiense]|uniref:Uncharacterized protein n=1 Tax=Microbacterium awajiense TaxID=415214 RepID=A0ABP7ARZ4_9MICO